MLHTPMHVQEALRELGVCLSISLKDQAHDVGGNSGREDRRGIGGGENGVDLIKAHCMHACMKFSMKS